MMTRDEAIAILEEEAEYLYQDDEPYNRKAFEMAIKALSQVSEIEENIIKYMKKYPNHVGNTDFWEGFYACRNVVLQLDDEEYAPKEQEPCDDTVSIRKDVLKCRVGNIVAYNVEWLKKHWQMEMDIVCGVKPCDDAISREAAINIASLHCLTIDESVKALEQLPSVTQKPNYCASCKHNTDNEICLECEYDGITRGMTRYESVTQRSGKWDASCTCSVCGNWRILESEKNRGKYKYCPNCGAKMVEPQESETWNGIHGQITAPKGTFKKIFEDAESEEISERNMKMWEGIFKAESEDKE